MKSTYLERQISLKIRSLNHWIKNQEKILMKLTIHGELTDLNTYINAERSNRYGAASLKKTNMTKVLWAIKTQKLKSVDCSVILHFAFYCPNKRKDKDNISSYARKVIQDALVESHILPNDGWNDIAYSTESWEIDKVNPRIEVEIERE